MDMNQAEKRDLVGGLVPLDEYKEHSYNEGRKATARVCRIEGAIRDCSKARHELMNMKELMSQVSGLDPSGGPVVGGRRMTMQTKDFKAALGQAFRKVETTPAAFKGRQTHEVTLKPKLDETLEKTKKSVGFDETQHDTKVIEGVPLSKFEQKRRCSGAQDEKEALAAIGLMSETAAQSAKDDNMKAEMESMAPSSFDVIKLLREDVEGLTDADDRRLYSQFVRHKDMGSMEMHKDEMRVVLKLVGYMYTDDPEVVELAEQASSFSTVLRRVQDIRRKGVRPRTSQVQG
jgi:hypothetical protein